jgi:hypothetical protein
MATGDGRIRELARGAVVAAVLGCALAAGPARANGNYSHVWVAVDAVRHLPEGDLKALLSDPAMLEVVRNGAMYPDGGYAVDDDYGEISHWEPFHKAYLEWIRATYPPPWTGDAAKHIAFLMGMTAHGFLDQAYDGMYLARHEHYDLVTPDPEPLGGLDGATDVCFAATQGPMEQPETWAPYEDLAPLYTALGHTVDPSTLELGQTLVVFAVVHASSEGADPAKVAEYRGMYPWACAHQDDPATPGSPVTVGRAVAAYWQGLWERLNGSDGFPGRLLGTWFDGGTGWDVPRDATDPASWVAFALPRGLDAATVTTDAVRVTDGAGTEHPVKLKVVYGDDSHVVNVKPLQDWAEDTLYTVTVSPLVTSWDDVAMAHAVTFTFSTGAAPVVETVEAAEAVEAASEPVPEAADVPAVDVPAVDLPGADVPAVDLATGDVVLQDAAAETGVDVPPDPGAGPDAGPGKGGSCAAASGAKSGLPAAALLLAALAVLAARRTRAVRNSGPRIR